jgi:hypothetical protein
MYFAKLKMKKRIPNTYIIYLRKSILTGTSSVIVFESVLLQSASQILDPTRQNDEKAQPSDAYGLLCAAYVSTYETPIATTSQLPQALK